MNFLKPLKLICVLMLLSLTACYYAPAQVFYNTQPKADYSSSVVWQLQDYIVKMPVKVNDEMILAIPLQEFFVSGSANFSSKGKRLLPKVAYLLKSYEKEDVQITSFIFVSNNNDYQYSDNYYRKLSLAREQARRVASFIWRNADARLIDAKGFVINKLCNEAVKNKRTDDHIEIRFQVFARQLA